MSAAWVAASVRARAMTRRRLGRSGASRLAGSRSLDEAVSTLAQSTYGHDVVLGQTLAEAQRAVVAAAVWNLRVLAGWSPREGVTMLRVLVGAVEIDNVLDHLASLSGRPSPPAYQLGGLATAWPRIQVATSAEGVRDVLAASAWGDPGAESSPAVRIHLRAALADRVISAVPHAAPWAAGATALLLARETLLPGRELPAQSRAAVARVLGPSAVAAAGLAELQAALPPEARWALSGVDGPADLWRAEARWWVRVDRDGAALSRQSGAGPGTIVGVAALLAVDAWRVRAALELAARGGQPMEAFDAVA